MLPGQGELPLPAVVDEAQELEPVMALGQGGLERLLFLAAVRREPEPEPLVGGLELLLIGGGRELALAA
jgi:hypothetical protein